MNYKVAIVILSLLTTSACNEPTVKIKPEVVPITESVYASVEIESKEFYTVHTATAGIIKNKLVKEGDNVEKGAVLFQLSNDLTQLNIDRAALSYESAKDNYDGASTLLRELENDIQTTELKLTNDSINYHRQKRLWSQNIGSRNTYDQMLLAYQVTQKNLNAQKKRYQRTKRDLSNQLKLALNQYESSKATDADFSIKSKIDGKVYKIYKEVGESVTIQEPLATVGSHTNFIIVLQIDEADIAKVKTGQMALVSLEAFGNQVFEASIKKIFPSLDLRSRTFRVEAVFIDPPQPVYPGLSGEANIVIAKKEDALIIPIDYLIGNNKVLTESGEKILELGLRSMDKVEVLSGIDSATYILKSE